MCSAVRGYSTWSVCVCVCVCVRACVCMRVCMFNLALQATRRLMIPVDSEGQSRKLKKAIVSKGLRSRDMVISYPALSLTVPPFWGGASSKMEE